MCAMCKANQQAAEREQGAAKARVDAQRHSDAQAREAALAQAATMRAQDYTPEEAPTHYVFLYGNASQYRATLHQKIDNPTGAFAFWEACAAGNYTSNLPWCGVVVGPIKLRHALAENSMYADGIC